MPNTVFLGSILRPDGYNGAMIRTYFVYEPDTGYLYEVHPGGYHHAGGYKDRYSSVDEARGLIKYRWAGKATLDVPA